MNRQEAAEVLSGMPMEELERVAVSERRSRFGNTVELCSIVNAKKGGCGENCRFCAQSGSPGTGFLEAEEIAEARDRASEAGVRRFSLVTSGRGLSEEDLQKVIGAAGCKGGCELCASLGILGFDQLRRLKEAGYSRYHHNLETSSDFFPSVCTSHSWEDRAITVQRAKLAGLSVCSGGLFGIGETDSDRVDLSFSLKELEVNSIPLNFFVRVEGSNITSAALDPEKILRITALFALVNPGTEIRLCAGREHLGESAVKAFNFGATGLMAGPLLTTAGSSIENDMDLIRWSGYELL